MAIKSSMTHVGCSINPPENGRVDLSKNLQTNQFHHEISRLLILTTASISSSSSGGFIN
jgi:hypothetical protein